MLVRIAVNDDQQQAALAEQLLATNQVFVSRTVLLESEWVLRSIYKNTCEAIALFFAKALNTENLIMEDHDQVKQALIWYEQGADFADALHLCICGSAIFHTFDQEFCKDSRKPGVTPPFRVLYADTA